MFELESSQNPTVFPPWEYVNLYEKNISWCGWKCNRAQIVKEPSYSVCGGASLNTVIASGIAGMKADGFQLVKGQLNV